jgi:hypothetical protein
MRWEPFLLAAVAACSAPSYTTASEPRSQADCKAGERFVYVIGGTFCYQVPPDASPIDAGSPPPDAHRPMDARPPSPGPPDADVTDWKYIVSHSDLHPNDTGLTQETNPNDRGWDDDADDDRDDDTHTRGASGGGPHCTKGCPCGNSCISCKKTCHK